MEKIEIVQFDGGLYAARRIDSTLFRKSICYLDLQNRIWRASDNDYISRCFSYELVKVKESLTVSGFASGTAINKNSIISIDDCSKMNEIAENDEGMKDLLLKAKEYFILKKK